MSPVPRSFVAVRYLISNALLLLLQPNFSIPQIRKVMDNQSNIRNMCVIAQYPARISSR